MKITPWIAAAGLALSLAGVSAQAAETLNGAGATFPYPVYSAWAYEYNQATNIQLNYQSIGSGGGIRQITDRTVNFGASDAPLTPEALEKAKLLQFPAVIGGVVPVVTIAGVKPGELKLDGETLAKIYLGEIKTWDDQGLKALSPDVQLPHAEINVVHRSDGSGTTAIFTNYLSAVSTAWKAKVGAGTSVNWPAGIGGKGNEGVSNYTQRTPNSIGYVEFAYAQQNKMTFTKLVNKDGKAIDPSIKAFQAAAANADWANAKGFYLVLTDQPGAESWPISGASFILVYKSPDNGAAVLTALHFFDWAYKKGDQMAADLAYVPIPDSVADLVRKEWSEITDGGGKAIW